MNSFKTYRAAVNVIKRQRDITNYGAIFFFLKHTGQTMLLVIPEIYIRKHQSEAGETQQAPLCGQLTAP